MTFAEQVEGLTLLGLLAQVGLVLAGRAGARLAAVLGVPVHRSTLLGLVAALPEPCIGAAPEVTGVDLSRSWDYPDGCCGRVRDAVVAGGAVAVPGRPDRVNHKLSGKASSRSGGW